MLNRRSRTVMGGAAVLLMSATFLPQPSLAQSEEVEAVTAAVQVTTNPTPVRAHSSPQIALNPRTGELVVVESDIQGTRKDDPEGTRGCNIHISTDGGRSWFAGGDPMLEPYTECSRVVINGPYATLDFDDKGVLYVAFAASDPKYSNPHPPASIPRQIFLARSSDGGRTFETTTVFQGPTEAAESAGDLPQEGRNQRAMVAVDQADSSRVYVSWSQGGSREEKARSLIAVSTDGGATFAEPTDLSDARGGSQPRFDVGQDGVVHAVFPAGSFGLPVSEPPTPRVSPLVYRRSTDGGATWSEPREIDPGEGGNRKWVVAADPNSKAVYVAWYGNPETPEAEIGMEDYLDVLLLASTDGGDTWSDRRIVNEGGRSSEGVKRYDPGLSIAPNGRLDIAWYDFRNSPVPEGLVNYDFNGGGMQDVYYTSSSDNGETFARPDQRITDRIIDRTIGVWSNNYHSHTNLGVTSDNGGVYFAWQDSRNGNAATDAEDVYFASLLYEGATLRGELAVSGQDRDSPVWPLLIGAFAVGMAIATGAFLILARKRTLQR